MKICYFGIYDRDFGRNKIYIEGLEQFGHKILECRDASFGPLKFWRLFVKHRQIKNNYDFMMVGYPGHLIVLLAKLISRKPVVADLLGSLEDAEFYSHGKGFWRQIKNKIIDRLAVWFADAILLESHAQKEFFAEKFGPSKKYHVIYTGAENIFFDKNIATKNKELGFQIIFRGKLTPESGIKYVLQAANLLKSEQNIKFKIIGRGYLLAEVKQDIAKMSLSNLKLIDNYLSPETLLAEVAKADLYLGQFADNPRLNRTIPHKVYEALAMGIPYLSGDARAIKEIITNGETGFLCPLADPRALADKILSLSTNLGLLHKVAHHARQLATAQFTPAKLASDIILLVPH